MPFCNNCGQQLNNNSKYCNNCGAPQDTEYSNNQRREIRKPIYKDNLSHRRSEKDVAMFTVALVFMIIQLAGTAIAFLNLAHVRGLPSPLRGYVTYMLISFAWTIPFTIRIAKIRSGKKPNTIGFGVAVLLLGNLISGIMLLIAPKEY